MHYMTTQSSGHFSRICGKVIVSNYLYFFWPRKRAKDIKTKGKVGFDPGWAQSANPNQMPLKIVKNL
jgi:hypothetical protein